MTVRILRGGSTGAGFHVGPGIFKYGYPTVRNGWADNIACGPGEVVACISHGDANRFAAWVAGKPDEVAEELRRSGRVELAECVLAACVDLPVTPASKLAAALVSIGGQIDAARIARALAIAGLSLAESGPAPAIHDLDRGVEITPSDLDERAAVIRAKTEAKTEAKR